jgi:hypothetical protein
MKTAKLFSLCLIIASLFTCCIKESTQTALKIIVTEKYPDFENEVQGIIKNKYGEKVFERSKWEWQFEEALKNNEYIVKYGCFRDLTFGETTLGNLTEDISEELSLGIVTYNPRTQNKGIYLQMLVNLKNKTVIIR